MIITHQHSKSRGMRAVFVRITGACPSGESDLFGFFLSGICVLPPFSDFIVQKFACIALCVRI